MKFFFLLFLFIISSCRIYSQPGGGGFSYCEEKAPRTFDPITSVDDQANDRIATLLYNGLFELNMDRQVEKKLVENYKFSDDNKKVTIKLKEGIKWSDGGELTAKDVLATFNSIRNSSNQYLLRVTDIFKEPVIEGTYQITFPIIKALPEDLILKKLIFKILPQHKLNQPLSPQSEIARKPVGTGYYKFERREPTLLELKRSDSNVGATKIDRVKVYIMPDYGTQKESLINKDVDLLIEVPPTEIKYLEASGFDICPYNSYEFSFIAINFNNKLLQLKNVRQALTIGYNRRNVLEKVYQRQGEVISGPFPRGSAYFLEEVKPFEYNPKSAKKLLSEAGFTKTNSEGFLVNSNGDELKFTLSVPKNRKWDDYQSKAVKQFVTDMKEIGIKILIEDMEFENYLENIKYKHNYDLAYGTLVFDDVGNVYPLFHSSNSKPGQENFITYNNPEVDQLLKQQNESMDESQKINLGRRLHKLLKEECPYVFLWSLENNAVVNPRIRNVHYKMTPFTFFGHINEWYIKE